MKNFTDDLQKHSALFQAIVDTPFQSRLSATKLGLGIVVLLLVDHEHKVLRRIALSNTEMASGAVAYSSKPFHEILIPLDYADNILIKAIQTGHWQQTEDWANLFSPELTPDEARFNQAGAGVACSIVYALRGPESKEPFGAMIFSYFETLDDIRDAHHAFMQSYTETATSRLVDAGIAD